MINTINMMMTIKMINTINMMMTTRWAIDASFRPPPSQHRCFLYRSNVNDIFIINIVVIIYPMIMITLS